MRWVIVLLAACHTADRSPPPVAPAPIRPVAHAVVREPPKLPEAAPPALPREPAPVLAADGTPATLVGQLIDRRTGEPVVGAMVVVRVDDTTEVTITDEDGDYAVTMPPGHAELTFSFGADTTSASAEVGDDVIAVDGEIGEAKDDSVQAADLTNPIPVGITFDVTDTITIDKNYIQNIPVPGRTFEAVLGAAAGEQVDSDGVSFSSHCGLENQYVVE